MNARALLVLIPLSTCAAGGPNPKAALSAYLEAEAIGRYDTAHTYLANADRKARPLERYVQDHLAAGPLWRAIAKRTTFRLGKPTAADAHTQVPVEATHLDAKAVEQGLSGIPTDLLITSPDPEAAMYAYIEGELGRKAFPVVTESLQYATVEEDGAWYVWLGLAEQDAAIDATLKARALPDDASVEAQRQAWQAVLAVPTDPGGAVAMMHAEATKQLAALGE